MELLKRPEVTTDYFLNSNDSPELLKSLLINEEVAEQININAKYEGYILKHNAEIEKFKTMESTFLPNYLDYSKIKSLSSEGREKLTKINPVTFGQASRISGVSRSDLSILMLYTK